MTKPRDLYRIEGAGVLHEIDVGIASNQVRFVFDDPLLLATGDFLELVNGQWFHISKDGTHQVQGKWSV